MKMTLQGQTHSVLFHSWLKPPFIFSYLLHPLVTCLVFNSFKQEHANTLSLSEHPSTFPQSAACRLHSQSPSLSAFNRALALHLPTSPLPSVLPPPPPLSVLDSLSFPLSHTHSGCFLPSPRLPSHSPLRASLSAPLASFLSITY